MILIADTVLGFKEHHAILVYIQVVFFESIGKTAFLMEAVMGLLHAIRGFYTRSDSGYIMLVAPM